MLTYDIIEKIDLEESVCEMDTAFAIADSYMKTIVTESYLQKGALKDFWNEDKGILGDKSESMIKRIALLLPRLLKSIIKFIGTQLKRFWQFLTGKVGKKNNTATPSESTTDTSRTPTTTSAQDVNQTASTTSQRKKEDQLIEVNKDDLIAIFNSEEGIKLVESATTFAVHGTSETESKQRQVQEIINVSKGYITGKYVISGSNILSSAFSTCLRGASSAIDHMIFTLGGKGKEFGVDGYQKNRNSAFKYQIDSDIIRNLNQDMKKHASEIKNQDDLLRKLEKSNKKETMNLTRDQFKNAIADRLQLLNKMYDGLTGLQQAVDDDKTRIGYVVSLVKNTDKKVQGKYDKQHNQIADAKDIEKSDKNFSDSTISKRKNAHDEFNSIITDLFDALKVIKHTVVCFCGKLEEIRTANKAVSDALKIVVKKSDKGQEEYLKKHSDKLELVGKPDHGAYNIKL